MRNNEHSLPLEYDTDSNNLAQLETIMERIPFLSWMHDCVHDEYDDLER